MISLGAFGLALLTTLQRGGYAMYQQLSKQVRLSASQAGQRLARLESEGATGGYRVVFSPTGLRLDVAMFASVKPTYHGDTIVEHFHGEISLLDAMQECYPVAGDADYMLRVVMPNPSALSKLVVHKLVHMPGVGNTRFNIVLTALRRDDALPLSHLGG